MIRYAFRDLAPVKGLKDADPQAVGEALAAIATANGELTPDATVEAAKNVQSPLHRHFEWDDAIAAQAHRLDQARALIRIVTVLEGDEDVPAPAFLSITDKTGTSYRTVHAVRESVDLQSALLNAAERELQAFTQRYRTLKDICEVVDTARAKLAERRKQKPAHAAA